VVFTGPIRAALASFLSALPLRRLVPVVAAAGISTLGPAARAGLIVDQLGTAGPGHFAILSLGGTTVSVTDPTLNGPGQTTGNVGVASIGKIALNSSSPPAIIGDLYLGNTTSTSGSAGSIANNLGARANLRVSGTISQNQDAFLGTGSSTGFWTGGTTTATGAVADALAAAMFFKKLTADQTIGGNITSSKTLTATHGGYYVINVTGDVKLGNGEFLTLSGAAGTQFVLNVAGNIKLTGGNGEGIILAGGLTTTDVVINVTSTSGGDNVTASGGSSPDPHHPGNTLPNAVINGILLDVAGGIGFSPGMVNGEIIGGGNEIRLVSGSQVNGPTITSVPEPTPIALALAGLVPARRDGTAPAPAPARGRVGMNAPAIRSKAVPTRGWPFFRGSQRPRNTSRIRCQRPCRSF